MRPRRSFGIHILAGPVVSWIGFCWDIGWHVDRGRDGFFSPPHWMVVAGVLIAAGGAAAEAVFAARERRVVRGLSPLIASLGLIGAVLAADNWWHSIFGIDVTVWSSMHLLLICGFGVAILAGARLCADASAHQTVPLFAVGLFLANPTTLFLEFEFGVPPYTPAVLPVLQLVLAGAAVAMAARASTRRWRTSVAVSWLVVFQTGAWTFNGAVGVSSPKPALNLLLGAVAYDAARGSRERSRSVPLGILAITTIAAGSTQALVLGRVTWSLAVAGVALAAAPVAILCGQWSASQVWPHSHLSARRLQILAAGLLVLLIGAGIPLLNDDAAKVLALRVERDDQALRVISEQGAASPLDWVSVFGSVRGRYVWIGGGVPVGGAVAVPTSDAAPEHYSLWVTDGANHWTGSAGADARRAFVYQALSATRDPATTIERVLMLVVLGSLAFAVMRIVAGYQGHSARGRASLPSPAPDAAFT